MAKKSKGAESQQSLGEDVTPAASAPTAATVDQIPVEIEGLDGINRFGLVLKHGVTELWGGNAHGKTRVQAAIQEVQGNTRKTSVSVTDLRRDGNDALSGSATVAGRTLEITRSGSVSRHGTALAGLSILDPGPVSRLIDPGVEDEEKRRLWQMRAFLELVPLEVTDERILSVVANDRILFDRAKSDAAVNKIGDMLEVTRRLRLKAQEEARGLEAESTGVQTAIDRVQGGVDEILSRAVPLTGESATDTLETLLGGFNVKSLVALEAMRASEDKALRLRTERRAFCEAEERQRNLRVSLGDAPPTLDTPAVEQSRAAAAAVDSMLREELGEVSRLSAELAAARTRADERGRELTQARVTVQRAEAVYEEQRLAALRWQDQKLLVDEPLSGPSELDVVESESEVYEAVRTHGLAVLAESFVAARDKQLELVNQKAGMLARAEKLREIEQDAWKALGDLVKKMSPVPEITLHNGYLAYRAPDGAIHDWNGKHVSDGQRNAAAFKLGAKCFGSDSILMIAGRIWETLDLEAKLALSKTCEEERIFGLTEVASFSADELKAIEVGSKAWVAQFHELATAAARLTEGE